MPTPTARRSVEVALLALVGFGVIGGLAGALGGILPIPGLRPIGFAIAVASLAFLGASTAVAARVPTLRALRPKGQEGARYQRLRNWSRLRAASLGLHVLLIAGAILLAFSMAVRGGVVTADIPDTVLDRGALVLVAALAAIYGVACIQSLVTPLERERGGVRTVLAVLGLTLQLLLFLVALLIQVREHTLEDVGLAASSTPLVLLAAFLVADANLAFMRLPPMSVLLSAESGEGPLIPSSARGRAVLVPVLGAFALLLMVFLLFVLFGVGVFGLLDKVNRSPILLGSLLFLVVSMVASTLVAVSLSKTEFEGPLLYKEQKDFRARRDDWVLGASIALGTLLLVAVLIGTQNPEWIPLRGRAWMHLLSAAVLVAVGPYGFLKGWEQKRIRRLEERFPDFLRDLASSHKGGLTLTSSVQVSARGEYGPLTPEIRKMADQLTWNVPFAEALDRFGERVRTPLVRRAVSLILEANRSGGGTTDVLLAAARDAREIKGLENERRIQMSLYSIVIYVTFFVFLAVVAVLYQQFVPQIVAASQQAVSAEIGEIGGLGSSDITLGQFQFLYFMAALVQALGDGIVAGLMGQGRADLGLRHSFLMVLCTYVAFALLL